MTDLLSTDQVAQIRQAMDDISDTFAFPVTIKKTSITNTAFGNDLTVDSSHNFTAIRDYTKKEDTDNVYRREMGPEDFHEVDLYILWDDFDTEGLIDANDGILLDYNDIVEMEGVNWKLTAFGPVAQLTKKPSFVFLRIQRRFMDPDGVDGL